MKRRSKKAGTRGKEKGRGSRQHLLDRETRLSPFQRRRHRLLLAYPADYRVGMSSLGLLTLHREVSSRDDWSVERVFLPPKGDPHHTLTALETGDPAAQFDVLGISVSHELELAHVAELLQSLGLPPRRVDRSTDTRHGPLVVIGGPLTSINPRPLAPLADLVIVGEADAAIHQLCDAVEQGDVDEDGGLGADGFWWPDTGTPPPPPAVAPPELLPAHSALWSPDAELGDMFLVEVSRGCDRACAFCATSRVAAGRCRTVPASRILDVVPDQARRVGLVGAAVSDHPELLPILTSLVESGREVGVSSVRVDRLDETLLDLLRRGGLRTLTLGADGASERLRKTLRKGVTEDALLRAAELAATTDLRRLKLYQLVGLPDEQDADLDELVRLTLRLSRILPITLALSPFVPKPGTPLADAEQAPIKELERRLRRVRTGLRGKVRLQPSSPRWAWVEARIARGDELTGEAILRAWASGARYADFRRELGSLRH
ncbi:MAG: radical SAM protein [bacterium]